MCDKAFGQQTNLERHAKKHEHKVSASSPLDSDLLRSNSSSPEMLPNMSGSMLESTHSEPIQNADDLALSFPNGTATRMNHRNLGLTTSGISPTSLANLQTAALAGQLNSSSLPPMGISSAASAAAVSHHWSSSQRQQQSQLANLQQLYWSSLMYQKAISGSVKSTAGINVFGALPNQIPVTDPLNRPLGLPNPNNIPLAALVQHQVARNNIPFFQ